MKVKHLGRALLKIARIMEAVPPEVQAELARQVLAAYGRPLTDAQRAARFRSRDRHGGVTVDSNGNVTESSHATVTASVTAPLLSTLCSSPSSTQDTPETTAIKGETTTILRKKRQELQEERREIADRLIDFLNQKAARSFRKVDSTRSPILARLSEGVTEQNCRSVIARQVREWTGTEMAKYLRPETLFNRTKFESYLGARTPDAETP